MDKFGTEMTELLPEEPEEEQTAAVREEPPSHTRSGMVEGRNAIQEALRSGKTADRLYVQDGLRDPVIGQILSKVKKQGATVSFVKKQLLDQMSETGKHQGLILLCSAYEYASMEEIFRVAEEREEPPFIFLLDEIEDPHNLGAIIRTANLCGAHGVIIPKHRAVGLTATVVKASAGAVNYTPVVKVTNIAKTIDELKGRGLWFACADMDGEVMYNCNLTGPIGLVIGNEGSGVSRLVREKCDHIVSVPMKGNIDSLNAALTSESHRAQCCPAPRRRYGGPHHRTAQH